MNRENFRSECGRDRTTVVIYFDIIIVIASYRVVDMLCILALFWTQEKTRAILMQGCANKHGYYQRLIKKCQYFLS